jgi:hypothetical protein
VLNGPDVLLTSMVLPDTDEDERSGEGDFSSDGGGDETFLNDCYLGREP